MTLNRATLTARSRRGWVLAALVVVLAALTLASALATGRQPTRQEEVAQRGSQVMPFDLDRTVHDFQIVENGGLERVTARDPGDQEQIRLIRDHLREEADKFRRGDFSDPAAIHGEDMPGLAELSAGADRLSIRYEDLPAGAQISYTAEDPALVDAIHTWFHAQTSDHGEHAVHH